MTDPGLLAAWVKFGAAIIGVVGLCAGGWAVAVQLRIKQLDTLGDRCTDLEKELTAHKLHCATTYADKSDFAAGLEKLEDKLGSSIDRLDGRMDERLKGLNDKMSERIDHLSDKVDSLAQRVHDR